MAVVEFAVVKWFDSREEKRFGFLTKENGEQVFFHLNDGRTVKEGKTEPAFVPIEEMLRNRRASGIPVPKPGDRIVFVQGMGQKGPKAIIWTYDNWWESVLLSIKNRPYYRIMIQYRVVGDVGYDEPQQLWEGENLSDRGALMHYDPKYDRPTFGCGDFDSRKWIEIRNGGNWTEIEYPYK